MRATLRSLATTLLILIVGVTSQSMAIARGQTRIADTVVICSGYGIVSIQVDAEGNPVGAPHICPDMALSLLAAPEVAPPVLLRPEGGIRRVEPRDIARAAAGRAVAAQARGPPLFA
ncbi:hypothetical protein [Frigidibacter oleivorans]|uniref:hypothetical protein n=1 Tax=Frigidibacter oleivorans TaxID=2487129 RepID=UPI000F8C8FCF|nr:hypothetical protein [Frigidibacter oleivorans]